MVTALLLRGAWACSFFCPAPERPLDLAEDVPTNAVVFASHATFDTRTLVLFDAEGAVVPTTLHHPRGDVALVRPEAPLLPFTRHELWSCDGPLCDRRERVFTTGAGPDEEAPAPPTERARTVERHLRSGPCGPPRWTAGIELDGGAALTLLDIDEESTFEADTFEGQVSDLTDQGRFDLNGPCGASLPVGQRGDTVTLRYAAMDQAGNVSGWTEPTELVLEPSGCSHARWGGGWALALLGVVARARRRPPPGRGQPQEHRR